MMAATLCDKCHGSGMMPKPVVSDDTQGNIPPKVWLLPPFQHMMAVKGITGDGEEQA